MKLTDKKLERLANDKNPVIADLATRLWLRRRQIKHLKDSILRTLGEVR